MKAFEVDEVPGFSPAVVKVIECDEDFGIVFAAPRLEKQVETSIVTTKDMADGSA